MSDGVVVPEWDVADRLVKSRRHAGLTRPELGDWMGVSRNSMSNYELGKTRPPLTVLRLWALRCGVPLEWLRYGDVQPLPEVVGTAKKPARRGRPTPLSTKWYSPTAALRAAS